MLYSKVVIEHLEEECRLVEMGPRRAIGTAADELVGLEAIS